MSEKVTSTLSLPGDRRSAEPLRPSSATLLPLPFPWASRFPSLARVAERLLRPEWFLVLVVALVVSRGITFGELHFNTDEMRHAMNGVFFRDLLADRPWQNPLQYAYEYYAKYPALAVAHWPPLFHIIEGVFFLVFGISVWVSRFTVLCFALLGIYFWYRIAEQFGPRYRALFSALILAFLPSFLLYERVTMLEIPSVATCLGAAFFWLRFLETQRPLDLWTLAAFTAAAFLTSQKAIFLVALLAIHWLVERRFRLLRRWDVWAALAVSLAVVLPWYLLTSRTLTPLTFRAFDAQFRQLTEEGQVAFYFKALPHQLGWGLVCLGGLGFLVALLTAARRHRFLLLWVVTCFACFTLIPERDTRHTMIGFPPVIYFALLAVEFLLLRRRFALVAQAGMVLSFLVGAWQFERPVVTGLEEVARYVLALPDSEVVYYQGNLNGNFIFFVRKFDPQKRHLVAREKQVVVSKIVYEHRSVLHTPEEVLHFFRTWGIRYAVIESESFLEGLDPVRKVLRSDQFELLRTFRLQSNEFGYANHPVRVYRYRGQLQRTSEPVVIPMMTIRNNIQADLSRLAGRPWPN